MQFDILARLPENILVRNHYTYYVNPSKTCLWITELGRADQLIIWPVTPTHGCAEYGIAEPLIQSPSFTNRSTMSGWTLPLSSSPAAPSTPGSNRRHTGTLESSSKFFASNPSTTPAGPPPSSVGSFTPADPPPSSIFGSSQLGSGKTLFKSKSAAGANTGSRRSVDTSSKKIDAKQLDRFLNNSSQFDLGSSRGATVQHTFGVPSSSPPSAPTIDGPEQYEDEEDEEESYDEEEDDDNDGVLEEGTMELDPKATDRSFAPGSTMAFLPNGSVAGGAAPGFGSSIMDGTPRGIKRSRGGAVLPYPSPRKGRKQATQESAIPSIAKNIATQLGVAKLEEPDDFILQTEDILQQDLYSTEILGEAHENALGAGLPNVSERLISIWQSQRDRDLADVLPEEDDILGIGPGENTPSMHKAVFLGSLLLQLRHPPTAKGKQALAVTRLGRSSTYTSNSHPSQALSNPTALPKVLLEWLDRNHNPYQSAILELQTYHPSPPAHIHFWEIVLTLSLRGKLADVVRIFKRSDFQHARTARDDGHGSEGYHGLQVRNIERVINRAIQVLELCPAIQDDDWNVTGNEWILFRKRIGHAMNDLATFAEGRDRDLDLEEPAFEASNFGLRSTTMGLSQSARKAESKVPWTIYQNLKSMYAILLGGTTEILAFSQDWVEATVCLTAWWDGNDDEEVVVGSLALTRRSLRHSQSRAERLVDVNANPAYLQRLSYNLALVTDDTDQNPFQISPINPVEVGLASVFEGNVEGVIGLLRGWSLTVASAVVEVASSGGWFESSAGNGVMNGFDESDLMVLSSYGQREQPMTRDSILMEYAKALSEKGTVQGRQSGKAHEGWELSIPLLTRLDDEDMATKRVGEILDRVPLESDARMDKILRICQRFGMAREARSITEVCQHHFH